MSHNVEIIGISTREHKRGGTVTILAVYDSVTVKITLHTCEPTYGYMFGLDEEDYEFTSMTKFAAIRIGGILLDNLNNNDMERVIVTLKG